MEEKKSIKGCKYSPLLSALLLRWSPDVRPHPLRRSRRVPDAGVLAGVLARARFTRTGRYLDQEAASPGSVRPHGSLLTPETRKQVGLFILKGRL